ncbi:MAG: HDOD domain-containing protein [Motiliproteus sp.]
MESTRVPQGLDQWVALLQDKLLPVPATTIALLRRQLQDQTTSMQQLIPIINRDPVMAMHCIGLANRLNRNPDTDVSTIDLAVSTLGLDRINELAHELPAIKLNSDSVAHKQYFHALADSYQAATHAQMLCRFKDAAMINTTRTAALLYSIGHWALWRYAPQQMSQIKIRINELHQDTALAEVEELGCTIQQISEKLIHCWHLSRLAEEALQHKTSPNDEMLQQVHLQATDPTQLDSGQERDTKQLLNAPYYPVKLANWLALTAPLGWVHPKTRRIEQLISDLLQQPLNDVVHSLHQNCVRASREHPMTGLMTPAALMLLLPSALLLNYRVPGATVTTQHSAKPAATPAPETTAEQGQEPNDSQYRDHALYIEALTRLTRQADSFNSRDEVLKLLLRAVVDSLGIERVLCYHVNYELKMTPLGHRGCSNSEPLTSLTLNLSIPGLFKRLSQKTLTVWINDQNRDKAWPALPERFKKLCHPRSFIISSLFGKEPQPLICYADMKDPEHQLNEFQSKQYKRLVAAAGHCLKTMP